MTSLPISSLPPNSGLTSFLSTDDYIGRLFIHKERKQFAVVKANVEGELTIPFKFNQLRSKPFCFPVRSITDGSILLFSASTEKHTQVVVVFGSTRRDAVIVDATNASINDTVKVKFSDDGQQDDVDLTNLEWRSTHGKKRAADSSSTGDGKDDQHPPKMIATADNQEVRDWLGSIGLREYTEQVIASGLTKLKHLKSDAARNKLEERCRKFMDEFDADSFVEEMNKFRDATVASASPDTAVLSSTVATDLTDDRSDASSKSYSTGASTPSSSSHSLVPFSPSSAAPASAGGIVPVPDFSQIDTSNYFEFVKDYPDLQKFPKKFTDDPKEFVDPYIYQKQLTLALLDTDNISAPESSILSIGTEFRGIGKSYLMTMMGTHLQGYSLTLDPKIDCKEIAKRRADPETWELFNERPLLFFDVSKNDKVVLGEKVDLGTYFEDLSSGIKCGGAWNPTSRPLIIFIGNDHLTLKSLGEFSGHRVDFYSIMSVGAAFPNAKGITDFRDYKLVVSQTMMAKIGIMAEEQVQKGSLEREATEYCAR